MGKNRLEAFSDGVLAIIITIMVLEIKVPHGNQIYDLIPLIPIFLSYALSFIYVGIYWNNHHHLLQAINKVNGKSMIANLNLLFWLSLVPFSTAWMGENTFSSETVSLYGLIMFMCAISYYILTLQLLKSHNSESILAKAIGSDLKGKVSLVLYAISVFTTFLHEYISLAIFVFVAILWIIPDKRIENVLDSKQE